MYFFRTFKKSTAPYKVHNMGLLYINLLSYLSRFCLLFWSLPEFTMSSSISPLTGQHVMFTSSTMPHGHEVMAWTKAETTKFLHDLQDHSGRFCTAMAQNSKWRHSNEAANPGIDRSTRLINSAHRRSRKGMFSKDVVIYISLLHLSF
jgi:hypothetical protein